MVETPNFLQGLLDFARTEGITQADIATRSGITERQISNLVTGKTKRPHPLTEKAIKTAILRLIEEKGQ